MRAALVIAARILRQRVRDRSAIVFSILMNGIGSNYTGARNLQDRMVVTIARYSS